MRFYGRGLLVASAAAPALAGDQARARWAGESVAITFTAPSSACQWDMKVKYDVGDTAERHNLNLCNTSISLFWGKNAGTTRAVTD